MAVEHPPPTGGPGPGPAPGNRGAVASAPEEAAAAGNPPNPADTVAAVRRPGGGIAGEAGASGSAGRVSRLQPSGPALEHAPLLLGLDAGGGERPQGGEHPDEEDLVGRVWGCVCGWRGTVRDVSTRPFHPRVGDGGGLRRQRLSRSDRGARPELDTHLARRTVALDLPATHGATSRPTTAANDAHPVAPIATGGPQPRRRRFTVPRDIPLAIPPATSLPSASEQVVDGKRDAALEDGATFEFAVVPNGTTTPDAGHSSTASDAVPATATLPDPDATARDAEAGGQQTSADLLARLVARADAARVELKDAESALTAAVEAARADGLSWRTIGRATGIGHRECAARWGPTDKVRSL